MLKPRLFIGSSRESLPLAEILATKLSATAEVDIWNTVFKSRQTYLETLRELPEIYDFGAFLLGPDDMLESRNEKKYVPRDNVIFELGLFMQVLGVKRALPVVPRGVKICSDFSGWKFIEYKEPEGWEQFRTRIEGENNLQIKQALIDGYKANLGPAVEDAAKEIAAIVSKEGINCEVPVRPVADSVINIWPRVQELVGNAIMRGASNGHVTVLHLALDMADAWIMLRDGILQNNKITDVTWRCLMIDPDSPEIAAVESDSVSTKSARQAIDIIRRILAEPERQADLRNRRVVVGLRTYAELPRLHGFMVEGQGLLLSMCGWTAEGRLDASRTPYFRFNAREESYSYHVVSSFHDWFQLHWEKK